MPSVPPSTESNMNPTIPAYGKWCAVLDLLDTEAKEGHSLAYKKAEADLVALLHGIPLPQPMPPTMLPPTTLPPKPTTLKPTMLPPTMLKPTTPKPTPQKQVTPLVTPKVKKESSSMKALRATLNNKVTYKKVPDTTGLEDWIDEQIYQDAALYSD